MRKLFSLFLALVATTSLWAYDFQSGDLYYKITSSSAPYTVEVTYEKYNSYYNYSSLITATIPETVNYNGTTYNVTSIGGWAFSCTSLTSVTIPNSVTSIGGWAFIGTALYNNPANWENGALYIDDCLIKVDEGFAGHFRIKENTRVILGGAFSDCSSLTSVTIPNSVTSIGDRAFGYCTSLTSMVVASGNSTYDSRDNCNAIIETATNTLIAGCQNTTIPNSVTSIGDDAFDGCSSLTSITIPNSVTSIGDDAFYRCTALTSITIPNSVTSIGEWAFYGCSALTSVTIPNSVTSIGEYAFRGCSSLTSITIPNSVTSIEGGAFEGCSSLTSVTIPNSVTSIGEGAFWGCSALTSVTIPNSVTSIGYKAFGYCSSLTSITIPNSVTSIGEEAFAWCYSLDSLTCLAMAPPTLGKDVFDGCDNPTLYVPCEALSYYQEHEQWGQFTTIECIL